MLPRSNLELASLWGNPASLPSTPLCTRVDHVANSIQQRQQRVAPEIR